ncbi:hypothetical protein TRAPUB_1155 [Trametes pubescens]|uniref:Uncharacterized protein n=1 Tax=Trametes pubescens TaxID=154538 RepID=A0A1M2VK11_TRAPU|nr:hypothetical protein TRAPUB_1155 [Trametes pubescens]
MRVEKKACNEVSPSKYGNRQTAADTAGTSTLEREAVPVCASEEWGVDEVHVWAS